MFVFVIIIFALLSVISPSNENIISRWGRNSILVYLLHPFLVDIEKTIINKFQIVNSNMILILFVVCAVFITDFLSRDFLMNIYNLVFNRFSQLINLGE